MPATLKRPRRRARALAASAETPFQPRAVDPAPPIEPPDCLKNRKPEERLSNSECIEALEWLQACIRSVVIKDDRVADDRAADDRAADKSVGKASK